LSADGTPQIKSLTKVSNGSMNNYSGSNKGGGSPGGKKGGGGGGGGKSKPAEKTKKSDIVKRYKELEDQLDDTREEADRLNESMDDLWGDDLREAMERAIELEERERDLLRQKSEEAKKYLEEDRKALEEAAKDLNITFTFDAKGNITDYAEEMTDLYEELAAMETAFGDEWSESEQE
jgi:chromosome segregation ATPase